MTSLMEKTQLEIAMLRNVSLIKHYTLPNGLRGILVIYGRGGMINLCAADKYFDLLEETAARIYSESGDMSIAADEYTRKVLESRGRNIISTSLSLFNGTEGSVLPPLPDLCNKVKALRGMIQYFMKDIYSSFGSETVFYGSPTGYRQRCAQRCSLDGVERVIPFTVSDTAEGYVFRFGNIFAPQHSMELTVTYGHMSISAAADCFCDRTVRKEYFIDPLHMSAESRVYENGGLIFAGRTELKEAECDGDTQGMINAFCGEDSNRSGCVLMPWGGRYFITEDKRFSDTAFLENSDGGCVIRHSRREYADISVGEREERVTSDSLLAVHTLAGDRIVSRFLPTGMFSRGIYKERFENKYYIREYFPQGKEH